MKFRFDHADDPPPDAPDGIILGSWLGGDRVLSTSGSSVVLPFEHLHRHVTIFGDGKSGKTETMMRIAHETASRTDAPVFYIDMTFRADAEERFVRTMQHAGRSVRIFPNEPFDGWRGDWHSLWLRLCQVADSGLDPVDTSPNDLLLRSVCDRTDGPPRSSAELLDRLDYESLLNNDRHDTVRLLSPADVDRLALRFRAFFDPLDGLFDGEWAWEDADAAYFRWHHDVRLDADRAAAVRFLLFNDLVHYIGIRKDEGRFCLVLADELDQDRVPIKDLVSLLRAATVHDTGIVMGWTSPGAVGPLPERKELYNVSRSAIVHDAHPPKEILGLVGESQRDFIDWNGPAALPSGTAWLIDSYRVAKVQIARALDHDSPSGSGTRGTEAGTSDP